MAPSKSSQTGLYTVYFSYFKGMVLKNYLVKGELQVRVNIILMGLILEGSVMGEREME